jgi:starch-binding outer membrane protein SusE/F
MNKKYLYKAIYLFIVSALLCSCKKDNWGKDLETTITTVSTTSPANNTFIPLDQLSNAVVTFEWQPVKTGDQTLVLYKVLFDKENGNFSQPLAAVVATTQGSKTNLILTHRDLNKIANKAGIKVLETGKVKWTVVASNGVVSDTSGEIKVLELKRPQGYAENPADVYITGSATEAGTDLTKAIKFKRLSDGVFELYTSLNTGTYKIIDNATATPLTFILDGAVIKDGTNANSPAATKTVYRIRLDFNTAMATLTEIQWVGLWFAGYNGITSILTYDANGVWKATDIAIVWSTQSWGKDERYKFRVVEKDMNGMVTNVFWSSVNKDNSRPASSTAASYYYFKSNDSSQWDYTFKFEKESAKADILVKFQASDNYTHQIIYK